jgi:hypothetical protein
MYVGFKKIEQGMDIGMDLGEEWGMGFDNLASDLVADIYLSH